MSKEIPDQDTGSWRKPAPLHELNDSEVESLNAPAMRRLLQELQTYKVELETQNEELLRTQKELETARARMLKLFHDAPVGYVILDRNGMILQTNSTFAGMMKLSDSRLVGTAFARLLSGDDEAIFRARFRSLFRNPERKHLEVRICYEGVDFYARLGAVPHRRADGIGSPSDYDELLVTVGDVTDRRKAEIALEKSKQTAESYLNLAAEIVLSLDCTGTVKILNDNGHRLLEYAPGELVGRNWFETCIPSRCRRELEQEYCRSIADLPENLEKQVVTRSGKELTILWHNTFLRDGKGRIRGILSSGKDITKRIQAQRELAGEKELLSITMRSIGEAVVTTDAKGKIVFMNSGAEQCTGISLEDAAGRTMDSVFRIVDEVTRNPVPNPVDTALEMRRPVELKATSVIVAQDGNERLISGEASPIETDSETTRGAVLVFRDITDKQKLLETMNRTDKLESLGILAGGIAHDFNNLLGGIFGYLDLARGECGENERLSRYLNRSLAAFDRARNLTQQLLTFSKGGTPVTSAVDINELVRESTEFALSGSNVTCTFHLETESLPAQVDKNQIGQVINNIVLNAQQAMPLGGRITVSTETAAFRSEQHPVLKAGTYRKIAISDTGIGIPPELQRRVFDPFFTTKQKGNGLGLATSYSIVQKHHGTIEIESEAGNGSSFYIYLPATSSSVGSGEPEDRNAHKGSGKILIMDDIEMIRDIAGEMLEAMGYEVVVASDGREALETIQKEMSSASPVRAALFDLTIPGGMGGKETIQELRKTHPDLPVFASSGYSDDPVMSAPGEFGFTGSIQKPYRKRDLEALLTGFLSQHVNDIPHG